MRTLPLLAMLLVVPAAAQQAGKALDHDAYDIWNHITERAISSDGEWVLYVYGPEDGDTRLRVRSLSSDADHGLPRGSSAEFTRDARHVVFLVKPPPREAVRQAEKDESDVPTDTLGFLDLATGEITKIPRVQSFEVPEEAGGWVAYLTEPDTTQEEESSKGAQVVLRSLSTGEERHYANATDYLLSADGEYLAYAASEVDSLADGMFVVATATFAVDTLMAGAGEYAQAAFDEAGTRLAFLSSPTFEDSTAASVHLWSVSTGTVETLAGPESVPSGFVIGMKGSVEYSAEGTRLFFGTAPAPVPEPENELEVELDVWNWKDPLLQPMQLVNLEGERDRTYRAVVHLEGRTIVQLADEAAPDVEVGREGEADFALAVTNVPYRRETSWDSPRKYDVYGIDVRTGERRLLLTGIHSRARLSPDARYVTWWDGDSLAWKALPAEGGSVVNLTGGIHAAFHDELHDEPSRPNSYGSSGWTEGDEAFLVNDDHDVWAVDPTGEAAPTNVTAGVGRRAGLRLRLVKLDDEPAWDPRAEVLLSAFDQTTKAAGFYEKDRLLGGGEPEETVMTAHRYATPEKAEDADRLLLTRESFVESPDLWVGSDDAEDLRRISDVNPQQTEYRWGSAELVGWKSLDGSRLQGMLFKPDGFDPEERYPMMVYFYERMSDTIHRYRPPAAGSSSISISFYVSRGYLVFVPDIPYRVGYPGESALHAVGSGVARLVDQGFVAEDRIGVQGHSWGGYQIAYMITETDLFAAAEAGAPVSNMTSAYGGIRWASGRSRMFQYERTQSRIGGSLWEYPLRYLDNSPLFQADKVATPVLMLHNDEDGAVPWYQGIEFFVALRRLGKPVWMLNYNGEAHGLRQFENKRDFAIRMQQFFDHYLMGAPAPVWMEWGVPAILKGKTLGLEPAGDKR